MAKLAKKTLIALTAAVGTIGVAATIVVLIFLPFGDPLATYVKPKAIWTASDFHEFLDQCSPDRLNVLEQSLKLKNQVGTQPVRVAAIKKDVVWESSNVILYPLKDVETVDYHKIVQWVAKKHGVSNVAIDQEPTFILERLVLEQIFKEMWDKLSADQKRELLKKIDTSGQLDTETLAAMGGTAALAALATTTYLTGFAFYTTMSTVIHGVAGFVGVTVPFAAYVGASSTVAFLSGPFGWTLISIAVVGNLALLGRADLREVTEFVIQMHSIKVVALRNSGLEVPGPSG